MGLACAKSRSGISSAMLNHSGQTLKPRRPHLKQRGLKKNSAVFKETFFTMIKLSIKLIDINWDKTILNSCILTPEEEVGYGGC